MTSAKDLAERLAKPIPVARDPELRVDWEEIRAQRAEASALLTRLAALGEPDADLVERLRKKARYGLGNGEAFTVLLREAADTIEGLNLELAEANATELHERIFRAETNRDDWRERAEACLATVEAALNALETADSWLERHAQHVGRCLGSVLCTCGLTAVQREVASTCAALHPEGQKDQVK